MAMLSNKWRLATLILAALFTLSLTSNIFLTVYYNARATDVARLYTESKLESDLGFAKILRIKPDAIREAISISISGAVYDLQYLYNKDLDKSACDRMIKILKKNRDQLIWLELNLNQCSPPLYE